jgi:hypothetical protein
MTTAKKTTKKKELPKGLVNPDDMTPEQLAIALKNTYALEVWINAVRAHAFDVLRNGGKVPGFKLGYGVRRRIWREGKEGQVAVTLAKLGFEHSEIFHPESLLSPAQVEALMKTRGLWPKKPRNGDRPPSAVDEFIERSMPEPSIRPEDEGEGAEVKARDAEKEFSDEA